LYKEKGREIYTGFRCGVDATRGTPKQTKKKSKNLLQGKCLYKKKGGEICTGFLSGVDATRGTRLRLARNKAHRRLTGRISSRAALLLIRAFLCVWVRRHMGTRNLTHE